jgi:hypothetical protein
LSIINDLKLNCDLIFNANFYQCGIGIKMLKFCLDMRQMEKRRMVPEIVAGDSYPNNFL